MLQLSKISQGYVLITKDLDFVSAESSRPQLQVVWIRTGNASNRVFNIGSGITVSISGLTITNGAAAGDVGGGIYVVRSGLTVSNCTISGSSANFGGGIYNDCSSGGTGTLTIATSTLSGVVTDAATGSLEPASQLTPPP